MFDLAKIPVVRKACYNPGAEPATKKFKTYLFWLFILLGRTVRLLGDEINFLWMVEFGLWLNMPPNRCTCFHGRGVRPEPAHLMLWAISLFLCLVCDMQIKIMSGMWHHYVKVYFPSSRRQRCSILLDLMLKDSSCISNRLWATSGQNFVLVVNCRSWFMWFLRICNENWL